MMFKTRELILVALFAALTAIGAFIKIPVPYVPFTLQFLFCAFSGLLLGSKLGAMSQIIYVGVGLLGLPIFTQGGGISYIFNPTFGYLLGFIVAAYVIGKITENIKNITVIKCFLTILSGLFFVYLFGILYLYGIYNFYLGHTVSFYWAFFYGFVVFILKDLTVSIIISLSATKIIPVIRSLNKNI